MGEGVGGVSPDQGHFAFLEFKISNLVHTLGEFLKYCLSPSSTVGTDGRSACEAVVECCDGCVGWLSRPTVITCSRGRKRLSISAVC